MIPDDVVAEVRERADIVDVIGEFVELKKAGREFKGLSPFKNERTPSFCVVPDKGFFHDFSSGTSGDVFAFLMRHQGMSFVEAVKYVGARSGIEVREVSKGQADEDPLRPYFEACAFAQDHYQRRLWGDGGAAAREYLAGRGVEEEVARRYGLGLAPDEWRTFREAAAIHGLDERILLDLGLLKKSEKSDEPYDAFRNRLIFPIETRGGKVVAFGGRLLGPTKKGAPKYLNSPESQIYHKGTMLYGLGWAKNHIRRAKEILLVEGYMDVVSLGSVGILNVVASSGTSLTEKQVELVKGYAQRILILFDSDSAGLRATFKAADLFLSHGCRPLVVTFPDGEDPDSVAQSGGSEALQIHMKAALDVLDRKIQILEERDFFSSIERTRGALDRLLPTLRAVSDPQLRDLYLARVSEVTQVRQETLLAELSAAPKAPTPTAPQAPRRPRSVPRIPHLGEERSLLLLILKDRVWVERATERIGAEDLEDPNYRAIFEALVADPDLKGPPDDFPPSAVQWLERLMADPENPSPAGQVFEESIARILVRQIDRRLTEINNRIHLAVDDEDRIQIVKEKIRLTGERKALGLDWRMSARSALRATYREK